jgi:hypothetical protein
MVREHLWKTVYHCCGTGGDSKHNCQHSLRLQLEALRKYLYRQDGLVRDMASLPSPVCDFIRALLSC